MSECTVWALIFIRFPVVPIGNQHKVWSKQHNGKVRQLFRMRQKGDPLYVLGSAAMTGG